MEINLSPSIVSTSAISPKLLLMRTFLPIDVSLTSSDAVKVCVSNCLNFILGKISPPDTTYYIFFTMSIKKATLVRVAYKCLLYLKSKLKSSQCCIFPVQEFLTLCHTE